MTRVLAVEDEEVVLKFVCRLITTSGATPIEARSVEEALELITPELAGLVTDWQIGSRLGTEVLEKFRQMCPKAPAVLMSGHSHNPETNEPLEETARRMEAYFMKKPFPPNDFLKIFQTLI